MRNRVLSALGVVVLAAPLAGAQSLTIDHQPVACAVAETSPRLEARFAPRDAVAAASIVFQPENTLHWYSVAMKSEAGAFSGVLPQPKKSLKAFQYYIEVTDKTLGTSRTANYTTNVAATAAACEGKVMAGSLGSVTVLLQVPEGAAAVPVGFSSTGVVAAGSGAAAAAAGAAGSGGAEAAAAGTAAAAGGGGGLSTGALVGIVAGVGAAGAGVAVAVTQLGGGSSGTTYSGPVNALWIASVTVTGPGPGAFTCVYQTSYVGTMNVTLEQSNGTATGQAEIYGTSTLIGATGGPNCGSGPGADAFPGCAVTGTPANLSCSDQRTSPSGNGTRTATFTFAGTLSGGVISGIVTWAFTGEGSGVSTGPFTTAYSGSTTFPVTLR